MSPAVNVPRLVVAAPASGHGTTTVATGLMAALRASGHVVAGHKVGPDHVDPSYHSLATGRPGRNLDPVLVGPELVVPLFLHGAQDAEIAVVEGVMGLFDGRGSSGFGSTAHVARLLDAPVVLVVDASSQSRSVAALVRGFIDFDRRLRVGGVVLNRVGSDRHEEVLRAVLAEVGVPVLGVLRRDEALATPSRHLGLVPVAERAARAHVSLEMLRDRVVDGVDLSAVMALARSAPPLPGRAWAPQVREVSTRPLLALAGGPAFSFRYPEAAELLAAAGADLVVFDPLRDTRLPEGTAGLVIGGGYPEVYAPELSANARLRQEVARLAATGAPVVAEAAGLLYLLGELDGSPMCGVLPATARMVGRLTLGYREAVAATGSVLAPSGTRITGHEFHRTVVDPAAGARPAWRVSRPGAAGAEPQEHPEGFVHLGVHASYLHVHPAAIPDYATRMVTAAAAAVRSRR